MDDLGDLTTARLVVRALGPAAGDATGPTTSGPAGRALRDPAAPASTGTGSAPPTSTPPDLAALALAADPDAELVWFDSGLPDGAPPEAAARARWSVLTVLDGPFRAAFRHRDRRARVEVAAPARRWFGPDRTEDRAAFAVLDDLLAATPRLAAPVDGCDFALGWVGYLGHELGRESGGPDRAAELHPDADLRFVDRAVLSDGVRAWAVALVDDGEPAASAANRDWLSRVVPGGAVCGGGERGLQAGGGATGRVTRPADEPAVCGGGEPGLQAGGVATGRVTRAAYESAVELCREEIRHGNAFQVCLTTAFAVPSSAPSRPCLEARSGSGMDAHPGRAHQTEPYLTEYVGLRRRDPVPFGAYLRLGSVRVASRSPERFLRITADGVVVAEPIKGTRPRGATPAADEALRTDLATSAKDRAENVMIVDLLRNDLLRSAAPGSVHVERLCAVETYASVHQLVSTIAAQLPEGASRAGVVRAAFPPGSMTGAPKISAMAIAERLEGAPRGIYSGVLGYFSASGTVDLSVAIRTLVTVVDDDGAVVARTLGAGGAVTWSSVAADEADEVLAKTASVLGGIGTTTDW